MGMFNDIKWWRSGIWENVMRLQDRSHNEKSQKKRFQPGFGVGVVPQTGKFGCTMEKDLLTR